MLIAFGGLPGTGKTTIARLLASRLGAVHLRIDSIEQAIRSANVLAADIGPAGYMAAYAMAADNLRLGHVVIADSVNPVAATRLAWRDIATANGAALFEVGFICSDPGEHRRRVEHRVPDIPGLRPPDWEAVTTRDYEPWTTANLVIDTASVDAEAASESIDTALSRSHQERGQR